MIIVDYIQNFVTIEAILVVTASTLSPWHGGGGKRKYLAAKNGRNLLISERKLKAITDLESTKEGLSKGTNPSPVGQFVTEI